MPPKYLYCPQCGAILFYVTKGDGTRLYFHVDREYKLIPTREAHAEISSMNPEEISCQSCSWTGPMQRLKKVFFG